MTDLSDPLDHFLAAKAVAVAALDDLERLARGSEVVLRVPAFTELTETIREFADETAKLNQGVAAFAADYGDAP